MSQKCPKDELQNLLVAAITKICSESLDIQNEITVGGFVTIAREGQDVCNIDFQQPENHYQTKESIPKQQHTGKDVNDGDDTEDNAQILDEKENNKVENEAKMNGWNKHNGIEAHQGKQKDPKGYSQGKLKNVSAQTDFELKETFSCKCKELSMVVRKSIATETDLMFDLICEDVGNKQNPITKPETFSQKTEPQPLDDARDISQSFETVRIEKRTVGTETEKVRVHSIGVETEIESQRKGHANSISDTDILNKDCEEKCAETVASLHKKGLHLSNLAEEEEDDNGRSLKSHKKNERELSEKLNSMINDKEERKSSDGSCKENGGSSDYDMEPKEKDVDKLLAKAMKMWYNAEDERVDLNDSFNSLKENRSPESEEEDSDVGTLHIDYKSPTTCDSMEKIRLVDVTESEESTCSYKGNPKADSNVGEDVTKPPPLTSGNSNQKIETSKSTAINTKSAIDSQSTWTASETLDAEKGETLSAKDPFPAIAPRTNSGKFLCSVCGKDFTFQTNLVRHQRNMHGRPFRRKTKTDIVVRQHFCAGLGNSTTTQRFIASNEFGPKSNSPKDPVLKFHDLSQSFIEAESMSETTSEIAEMPKQFDIEGAKRFDPNAAGVKYEELECCRDKEDSMDQCDWRKDDKTGSRHFPSSSSSSSTSPDRKSTHNMLNVSSEEQHEGKRSSRRKQKMPRQSLQSCESLLKEDLDSDGVLNLRVEKDEGNENGVAPDAEKIENVFRNDDHPDDSYLSTEDPYTRKCGGEEESEGCMEEKMLENKRSECFDDRAEEGQGESVFACPMCGAKFYMCRELMGHFSEAHAGKTDEFKVTLSTEHARKCTTKEEWNQKNLADTSLPTNESELEEKRKSSGEDEGAQESQGLEKKRYVLNVPCLKTYKTLKKTEKKKQSRKVINHSPVGRSTGAATSPSNEKYKEKSFSSRICAQSEEVGVSMTLLNLCNSIVDENYRQAMKNEEEVKEKVTAQIAPTSQPKQNTYSSVQDLEWKEYLQIVLDKAEEKRKAESQFNCIPLERNAKKDNQEALNVRDTLDNTDKNTPLTLPGISDEPLNLHVSNSKQKTTEDTKHPEILASLNRETNQKYGTVTSTEYHPYKCDRCGKTFQCLLDLKQHMDNIHFNNKFQLYDDPAKQNSTDHTFSGIEDNKMKFSDNMTTPYSSTTLDQLDSRNLPYHPSLVPTLIDAHTTGKTSTLLAHGDTSGSTQTDVSPPAESLEESYWPKNNQVCLMCGNRYTMVSNLFRHVKKAHKLSRKEYNDQMKGKTLETIEAEKLSNIEATKKLDHELNGTQGISSPSKTSSESGENKPDTVTKENTLNQNKDHTVSSYDKDTSNEKDAVVNQSLNTTSSALWGPLNNVGSKQEKDNSLSIKEAQKQEANSYRPLVTDKHRFKCVLCDSKFTFRSNLNRHIRNMHKNDRMADGGADSPVPEPNELDHSPAKKKKLLIS